MKNPFTNKQNNLNTEEIAPVMLAPETLRHAMRRSRLGPLIWYKALWLIQKDKDINPYQLASQLNVSWQTAEDMKKKLSIYII